MEPSYVGIDVSKAKLDLFVEVKGKARHHLFGNSQQGFKDMLIWLGRLEIKNPHFCLEATGSYWESFATYVCNVGIAVSVVNPSCIKRFAQSELKRTKTDKVDAGVIYRFACAMGPKSWTPPPQEVQLLQALCRRLHGLGKIRRQELNRREAESEKRVTRSINTVLKTIDSEMEKIRKRIKVLIAAHKELRRKHALLVTIPGVGDETANLILSEVPNLDLFAGPKQLVAFAGLAPKEVRSGSSIHGRSMISKTGNTRLRSGLYMAAVSAMKWNPIVAAFADRLLKRGKPTMKVVGASMRKLLHVIYGVLKSGKPFRADLVTT
jgi:transposase